MKNRSARGDGPSRRRFLAGSVLAPAGAATAIAPAVAAAAEGKVAPWTPPPPAPQALPPLGGARWLWYPSERTLPNTFVLFRRVLDIPEPVRAAAAYISADSRYLFSVNGRRMGFGPAPCDPRFVELDRIDITAALRPGPNVLGATVLFYGHGDGTWAMGKPGFLFRLSVETVGGRTIDVVSDDAWRCRIARAWRPGQFKRWYLRALQEEFDARLHPHGWDVPGYRVETTEWRVPMALDAAADRPPIVSSYSDYLTDSGARKEDSRLRPRSIAPLEEKFVRATLVESHGVAWAVPPEEYFEFKTHGACRSLGKPIARADREGHVELALDGESGAALTFELPEQMVGWPSLVVKAPAGTKIEVMVQEGHVPGGPPIMNTHRHSWSRFICREGENQFTAFDYESCRWLQLHLHGARGRVSIRDVGLLRRQYPFAQAPHIRVGEPGLARLVSAGLNTMTNAAQETLVDGMGRERQQYSGDIGHQVHALHLVYGETRLPARFLTTFSQGLTRDGFFLDCWPAYDRLNRLGQRQLGATPWGPLVDHGVGFCFDNYHHYLYTGRREDLVESYPRLVRFAEYLRSLRDEHGLLPVEDLGVPTVWIDHDAYQQQRHKQCAFNLYAAAALMYALPALGSAMGEAKTASTHARLGRELLQATVRRFWDGARNLFVANRPWLAEEGKPRLDDRSLATAILYGQCPGNRSAAAVQALVDRPPELGLSYPANAVWPMWALFEAGRADAVLRDLRERWSVLQSVIENNTLSEDWRVTPDTRSQWSHSPLAPLLAFPQGFAGIRPDKPGFAAITFRPQLADLVSLQLTAHTVRGPARLAAEGTAGKRALIIETPPDTPGTLIVDAREDLPLARTGKGRFALPPGRKVELALRFG